jgi:hypothetical protein
MTPKASRRGLLAAGILASMTSPAVAAITTVTVRDSSEAFLSAYSAQNVLANAASLPATIGTDYSSRGAGTSTFIDFDFGTATRFDSVTYIDRLHNGGELTNPPDEKLQVWWTRSDLNSDRKIQQNEMVFDSVSFFDQLDSDADGVWSPTETTAANAEALRLLAQEASRPDYLLFQSNPPSFTPGNGQGGTGLPNISASYDKNRDGVVTRAEAELDGLERFANIDQNADGHVSGIEALRFGRTETQRGLWSNDDNLRIGGTQDFTTSFNLIFSSDSQFGNDDDITIGSGLIAVPSSPEGIDDFTTVIGTGGIVARYMRWDVTSATGANPGAYAFQFASSAVPEPASWAMLIAGFFTVGSQMRRRTRPTQPATA